MGVENVSLETLVKLFGTVKGTRIVTATIETEPKLRAPKSNPLLGRIKKVQTIQGPIGFSYENAVNKQRDKEAIANGVEEVEYFKALAVAWAEHIEGSPLMRHKKEGTLYVPIRSDKTLSSAYIVDGKEVGLTDEIEGKTLKDWLYFAPEGSGRQEVETRVPYLRFRLDSLRSIAGLTANVLYNVAQ